MAAVAVATERPDEMCRVIHEEFARMPRMRLTRPQFQRLWHLSDQESADVVAALVDRGVLAVDALGRIRLVSRLY